MKLHGFLAAGTLLSILQAQAADTAASMQQQIEQLRRTIEQQQRQLQEQQAQLQSLQQSLETQAAAGAQQGRNLEQLEQTTLAQSVGQDLEVYALRAQYSF